ncbi:hypothetical protein COY95_02260, partial [Candidatus Woesearchaeota archaeon CG_4_10_14_0_8_um_filter_47_5]
MTSKKKGFCVICGKKTEAIGLCNVCFLEKTPLIAQVKEFRLVMCASCGRFLLSG